MNAAWNIMVDVANIQDGNHDDFICGQVYDFAVEFNPISLMGSYNIDISARLCTDNEYEYDIVGKNAYIVNGFWVINIGIEVYAWGSALTFPPKWVMDYSFCSGTTTLEVDWYVYKATFRTNKTLPPLKYYWRITRIREWDSTLQKYVTDSDRTWSNSSNPITSYLLTCELLDLRPTYP